MYRVIINNAVKIDLDFEKEWTFGEIFKCYNLTTDVTTGLGNLSGMGGILGESRYGTKSYIFNSYKNKNDL